MKEKLVYSTERIKALRTPAIYSEFIHVFDELKAKRVVVYSRESSPSQYDHLKHQTLGLMSKLKEVGWTIIGIEEEVAKCWWNSETGFCCSRSGFYRAIMKAKSCGAVVVAECVNRFFRVKGTSTVFDLKQFQLETDGVQLVTVNHPNASPAEQHRVQTKRGQRGRGHYGGRPKLTKKARREKYSPVARQLRNEGNSLRKIGMLLGIPFKTISDWLKRGD
jgi:DNA invertase Pin-like site-specific DNA recombinase